MNIGPVQKRRFRDGVELSVVGLGGMTVLGHEPAEVDRLVSESIDRGINFFDVAPAYGDGRAECVIGAALGARRDAVFLASKTLRRSGQEATADLEESLRRLRTDRLDLYQCHAVHTGSDVERLLAPSGAIEAMVRARHEGKVRYLGFSVHTTHAALRLLDAFDFDSISLPVNFVCDAKRSVWREVLERAIGRDVARLALKSMALTHWRKGESRAYPHCWYKPIDERELASLAIRFSLSEDITSVLPPADVRLFRIAVEIASNLSPLVPQERMGLTAIAAKFRPVLTG